MRRTVTNVKQVPSGVQTGDASRRGSYVTEKTTVVIILTRVSVSPLLVIKRGRDSFALTTTLASPFIGFVMASKTAWTILMKTTALHTEPSPVRTMSFYVQIIRLVFFCLGYAILVSNVRIKVMNWHVP
uniref:Uncharacterized protein n=1 Tax=Cacopsylla melanoneura TaxID=428564 RepID=A0A8D8T0A4_9HEMI